MFLTILHSIPSPRTPHTFLTVLHSNSLHPAFHTNLPYPYPPPIPFLEIIPLSSINISSVEG